MFEQWFERLKGSRLWRKLDQRRNRESSAEPQETPAVSAPTPKEEDGGGPSEQATTVPAPMAREKIGLVILHSEETAAADIVAVHGLCGDPYDTWTDVPSNKLWLKDFLPSQVPNIRIMSFGYDSSVAFSKSVITLDGIAADLLNRLDIERDTREKMNRPMIFICHSLGGIVVKKALILAHERSEIYGDLLEKSKAIIFFGTPHNGTAAASLANVAAKTLKALQMGTATNTNLVSDLEENSKTLGQISEQFVERGKHIQMKTFYEGMKLDYMNYPIVGKRSAVLNVPTESLPTPITADHRSMCKFASADEQKYKPVWKAVKTLVEALCPLTIDALYSIMATVNSDQLLRQMPAVDQEGHKSRTDPSSCDQPGFYWIFKNTDFIRWLSDSSEVLWLSGPAKTHLTDASSHIVDLVKESPPNAPHLVLFFFCSTASAETSVTITFVNTIIHQLVSHLPQGKEEVTTAFLRSLLDTGLRGKSLSDPAPSRFRKDVSAEATAKEVLKVSSDGYWRALSAAIDVVHKQELSLIIDGLDKIGDQKREFVTEIRAFIEHLREKLPTTRVLLTSRPQAEIKDILSGLRNIEYDKERKECLNSLRFENTRYEKISGEHQGSLEWLWANQEYRDWSSAGTSDFLLIEGKPGSGKSTLMKYVQRSLTMEPCEEQVVASFYYSYREGAQQTNHSNMLRSVLYDILNQNEAFFFHFQTNYRKSGDLWSYHSLEETLLSITKHHPVESQIYLIIDAVDESVCGDRYNVIKLLRGICAMEGPCVVKVFVASRPIPELNRDSMEKDKVIKLENANTPGISNFVESFLLGPEFPPHIIEVTKEYVVENAQGVFLWAHLVKEELLRYSRTGATENQISSHLRRIPKELDGFYTRILTELQSGESKDIDDGFQMLQIVLFAYRPLTLEELRQALAISCSSEKEPFEGNLIHGIENRLISCAGNFLEIKTDLRGNRAVQIMHNTVREFFRPDGPTIQSRFRMNSHDAHKSMSITCVKYLLLCIAGTSLIGHQAGQSSWKPKNFEACARYLNTKPFFSYALQYIKQHLLECSQDLQDSEIASQLRAKLNESRSASYLFGNWAPKDWSEKIISPEELDQSKRFRTELLQAATRMKYSWAVEGLLIAGAEVDAHPDGKTPLIISAEVGDLAAVRALLDQGADIRERDGDERTILHLAAANGHDRVTGLLLQRGADKEARDKIGWTALHLAAENGHNLVAELLIDQAADKEAKGNLGWTPLHLAAANGHNLLAKLLTDKGADKEAKDQEGRTALHIAAANGRSLVAGLLIDQDCDKEARDREGQTGLHIAAANGHNATIRVFIDRGASKEAKDDLGWEALHTAAWTGRDAIIRELVQTLGANKEARDTSGWTALHVSIMNGHHATSRWLIEHLGVDKMAKDNKGWTALHFAAALGFNDTVLLLLENLLDVDRNARNDEGKTALDLARE